jgi:ankyrin repeat protein
MALVVPNLFLAAQNNDKDLMIEALKTTDINMAGPGGYTALMVVANYGFVDMVDYLLSQAPSVNAQSEGGQTALALSISPKEEESALVVEKLLAAGADVNLASGGGNTPLMEAAYQGNKAVLQLVLKAGADVNAVNKFNETALFSALVGGDEPEIVSLLLKAGINKELANTDGELATDIAHRLSRPRSFTVLCS